MNNSAHPSDVLSSISGETVLSAWAQEMAFYGPDDNGLFTHPNFNFIQATVLEMRMLSGKTVHFTTSQNDDEWALWPSVVSESQYLISDTGDGLFRTRDMPEFPSGRIDEIEWSPKTETDLQLIRMKIGTTQVILRAGEVYESTDGKLTIHDRDNCVLIFLSEQAHSRTIFNDPIYEVPNY